MLEKSLTLEQVADILTISPTTVKRLVRRRALTFHREGKQLRFLPSDVEVYRAKTRCVALPAPACQVKGAAARKSAVSR